MAMKPDLVLDIGTNYGEIALCCRYTPETKNLLFEPNPRILPFLRKSVASHYDTERMELVEAAVSNETGPAALIDRKAPGKPPKLGATQQAALVEIVEAGPIPAVHGVVRWRLKDLEQWVWEEFGVTMDETTMGRLLERLGFRHISARPRHHAQDPRLMEAFKKTFPSAWKRSKPSSGTARP